MKPNKLIVMSIDAMIDEDMDYIRKLPNFEKLFARASYVKGGTCSIYPALTYPCHVSMITGTYPEKHGIFHNEILNDTCSDMDWYWFRRQIRVPTLLDAAHEAGLTTACLGWPCMGADRACDWIVPEIWPKWGHDNLMEVLEQSATANVMEDGGTLKRHLHIFGKLGRVFVDQAMIRCACDLIRKEAPDVMVIHVAHLDHMRHVHGVHGDAIEEALILHDDWLGCIMDAVEEAGIYDNTNFAIVSDHGHLPVSRMFQPNVLLAQNGLIHTDENGRIIKWDAICNSASLSAQVHIKNPSDTEVRQRVEKLLYEMRRNPDYGVEAVFHNEELQREHHLTGSFSYVLEGKEGTSFGNACTGDLIVKPDNSDYKFSVSSHGHLPYKGPQPVWIMSGPDVKEGAEIGRKRIIDEAPTFAEMLHLQMKGTDGSCVYEFLKEGERSK